MGRNKKKNNQHQSSDLPNNIKVKLSEEPNKEPETAKDPKASDESNQRVVFEKISENQSDNEEEKAVDVSLHSSSNNQGPITKNQKKKEKRKKNKNKREIVDKIFMRNASEVKCPIQLEQQGILVDMPDVKLYNYNSISRRN